MTNETRRPPRPPRNPSAVDSRRRGERWVEQTIGRLLATTHHDYNVEAIADDLHTRAGTWPKLLDLDDAVVRATITPHKLPPLDETEVQHHVERILTSPGRFESKFVWMLHRYPPRLAHRVLREVGSRILPNHPGKEKP